VKQLSFAFFDAPHPAKPRTRGECKDGPRPCPWLSCRHHLYLDVSDVNGAIRTRGHGDVEEALAAMPDTCALDVADRLAGDELPLVEVGRLLGLKEDRVSQVMKSAQAKLAARWR
jgi:hypothetical protein